MVTSCSQFIPKAEVVLRIYITDRTYPYIALPRQPLIPVRRRPVT